MAHVYSRTVIDKNYFTAPCAGILIESTHDVIIMNNRAYDFWERAIQKVRFNHSGWEVMGRCEYLL